MNLAKDLQFNFEDKQFQPPLYVAVTFRQEGYANQQRDNIGEINTNLTCQIKSYKK